MEFGQRSTAPARTVAAPRTRRGGYWLGLLTYVAASVVTLALMPFISQFQMNGASLSSLIVPAALALVSATAVAAVLMLLVDLALRGLGWRRPWIYSVTCAFVVFAFYLGLAVAGGTTNPVFALYVAVWPAGVGGWVMGLYRR